VEGMLTLQQFGKVYLKAADREFNEGKLSRKLERRKRKTKRLEL